MRRAGCAWIAASALALPATARAVPLLTGPGGPADYGTRAFATANDDESTAAIGLAPTFPAGIRVAGATRTALHINNNGSVTFGSGLPDFTPMPFPSLRPMIAGWWADVDTRGSGNEGPTGVFWRRTASEFVVTWSAVGYFDRHADRRDSFQIVLRPALCPACAATDFEAEFRYARCEWTTGDRSGGTGGLGGTTARAGFNFGPGTSRELPGSGTAAVISGVCGGSNVDEVGRWVFCVRDSVATDGACVAPALDGGAPDAAREDARAGDDAFNTDVTRRDVTSDSGPVEMDAGADGEADAAETPNDVTQGYRPAQLRFRGGGCQCDARRQGAGARGARASVLASALIALCAAFRRRRRRRGERSSTEPGRALAADSSDPPRAW